MHDYCDTYSVEANRLLAIRTLKLDLGKLVENIFSTAIAMYIVKAEQQGYQ